MAVNIDGDTGIDKVQTGAVEIQDIAATGTASSSTFLRGDGAWESAGQAPEVQVFTAPGTWTKPTGLKAVKVTVVGGGGGGGGMYLSPTIEGGVGGGGGAAIRYIPAPSIPGPVTVTRGAGGAGGTLPGDPNSSSSGSAGGTSSFGPFVSATGGGAAAGGNSDGVPGSGGSGSNGDINIPGGKTGTNGRLHNYSGTILSVSNNAISGAGNGQAGTLYGGGGSGGLNPTQSGPGGALGGAGANGIVIVEEFY